MLCGIAEFSDSTMKMDHQVVREISALVSGLPVMSDQDFQLEFLTVRPARPLMCDLNGSKRSADVDTIPAVVWYCELVPSCRSIRTPS